MVTLLNLVESLETGLVDDKLTSQRDSLKSLVSRLKLLSIDQVQELEVDHLVTFFTSRLAIADPEVSSHLLDGFLWLVQAVRTDGHHLVTPTQAVHICRHGLFANLVVQSLTKSARLRVFKVLHTMLHGHQLSGLQSMGSEFVSAYVQAIDGEKDPENLILIFQMNLIVMRHFPIDHVKEDFFEVMSVYFPVDFSPPPDVIGARITRSSLAEGLHHCLFTSRSFSGPYLLPLLCEKADSDLIQAQFDSLALLADCLHGCLQSVSNGTNSNVIDSRGPSIPFHHLSSYLVLVAPMLANLINKTKSRKVMSLTTACLTGLVHSYATQVSDAHHLRDFAIVLFKAFGVYLDRDSLVERNDIDVHSPVSLSVRTVSALLEVVRSARTHQLLCGILMDYLVPYFGSPLFTWSQTGTLTLPAYLKQVLTALATFPPDYLPYFGCRYSLFRSRCSYYGSPVLSPYVDLLFHTGTPKTDEIEMNLDSLDKLHCNLSNIVLELHRTVTLEAHTSELRDRETSSVPLAIVLVGLSIRLYSVRRQLANTLDVDGLFLATETLGHLVGLWEQLGLTPSVDSDMSISEDLGVVVSRLYSMNCLRVVDKLNEMLLAQIEGKHPNNWRRRAYVWFKKFGDQHYYNRSTVSKTLSGEVKPC
ncbi:DNA repair/transcription protein MET18/MMS19 [Paragonimus westermani]|uniref:MMS19 nucleotide excision repair protein n=1 Tax=Paragonimus westermani TaxID=34504 RepID=A0A5J4P1B9_9TREM|nr:DNA repair/transcription protein MET18/MMS19 [Paragonimus westermani]